MLDLLDPSDMSCLVYTLPSRACSKTDENTVKKVSSEIVAARNVVRTP